MNDLHIMKIIPKEIDKNEDVQYCKVTTSGNIIEVMTCNKVGRCTTKKLSKDFYVNVDTGEIGEYEHGIDRTSNIVELKRTFKELRDIINTNCTDATKLKWVTLTYRENMTDTKQIYKDFEIFRKKMIYHFGNFEYITAIEPQGRGAWHFHLIMIFPVVAPYIPNSKVASIWSHGFTKTQKIDDCDNIGAYLSAYLANADLDALQGREAQSQEEFEQSNTKKYIKGERLKLYPPHCHIYRHSRGIKKPLVERLCIDEVKEKIGSLKPTFSKAIYLYDDDENPSYENTITYYHYNTKRK